MTSWMGTSSRFSFGCVTFVHVGCQRSPFIPFAHLAAIGIQDERDVGILGRFHSERAKESEMFGGVGQVILPADHMGDVHFQVVDHIHKMEDRLAIRANQHKVRVEPLTVG